MKVGFRKEQISVCKNGVCVNIYGDLAKAVAGALIFAAIAYGISQLTKPVN